MRLGTQFNHVIGLAGLFALALSANLAAAKSSETITIQVRTDDGLSEKLAIDDLAVGDTEVFLTESGKEALVTRVEDGLSLEIDGRVIDVALPRVDSLHDGDHPAGHRVMVMSGDAGVLHGEGEMVFFDEDVTVEAAEGHRIVVKSLDGEKAACPEDGDCRIIKRVRHVTTGDGEKRWIDGEGNTTIVIDGEHDDVEFFGDALHSLGDGDHEVIVIEREVELHEELDDEQH